MKKVLSIVLSIAMVVCLAPTMAFAATTNAAQSNAAYSDIEGKACEGAVNVLSALKVVDGFTDGTYKPEQTVTRAQMAKLIVTALGVADYATAKTSKYTDMGAATWAIPYVEYASNLNIVNGVGNNKFNPNGLVTYEQAATMIVRALGYTDQCKEMNGTWPAIYIQKAMALNIFDDVVNGGANGANRGDVAIMLYNALDLAQVYADADGATQYKTGNNSAKYNGKTVSGVSMMGILNKNGDSKYVVITSDMADDALTNIREYVGAAAKVTTDKNGHVLAVGDIKTTFLSGKVSKDGKKLEVGDVEYTLPTTASDYVDVNSITGGKGNAYSVDKKTNAVTGGADYILNGDTEDEFVCTNSATTVNQKSLITDKGILNSEAKVTIAANVSGKTIKEIYSVAAWTVTKSAIITESQINTIKNKKTLLACDFGLNDDREIDPASFELVGVDSLDKIEKDDVVYVYTAANNDKNDITRVAVGQKVVNGEISKITDNGKKYTIDGTTYKLAQYETDGISTSSSGYSIASTESVKAGDKAELTLDAYYVYKLEADSTSRLYAAVLKLGKDNDSYGETTYSVKMLTANGETVVANVDDDYEEDFVKAMAGKAGKDTEGFDPNKYYAGNVDNKTIVKYHLNSSNEIDFIESANDKNSATDKKVTSGGYYNGYALASNVTIFSYNGADTAKDYAKADNYTVLKYDSAIGKEFSATYALDDDDKIVLMVADDLVANDIIFGLVTGSGSNNSDAGYYVEVLTADGKTTSYDCTKAVKDNITGTSVAGKDMQNLIGFKVSSNNEIKSGNFKVVADEKNFLGGDDVLAKSGIVAKIENGRITIPSGSYAYTNNVVVFDNDNDDNEYKADASTSDIEVGDTVAMYDIDGEDGVYDIIVITAHKTDK